ncbi:MAG: DNAJC11 domain-containing protein [Bryobacteraceae bacterium]
MTPGDTPSGPRPDHITFNLDLNQMIERVDTNIRQEIMVITADKVRLCLLDALERMERRKAWMTPAGILATLIVIFPTTTFQDFLGFSKDYWRAIFSFGTAFSLVWLVICLIRIRTSLTIEQIVERLRTDSLAAPLQPSMHQTRGDLAIIKALYGAGASRLDVTDQLNKKITGSELHVYVGNQLAGDPCPNTPKDLVVKYRYKNQEHEKTAPEGADLDLP